jgi:hypothetical protein
MSAKKSTAVKVQQQPKVEVEDLPEDSSSEVLSENEEVVVEKTPAKKAPAKKNAAPAVEKKTPPAKTQPAPKTPVAKKAPAAKKAVTNEKSVSSSKNAKNAKAVVSSNNSSEETEETAGGNGIRYFKILADKIIPQKGSPVIPASELSFKGGRFKGRNPMQAAKKAFTGLCKAATKLGYEGECSYIFTIQETSQGSHKKEFPYSGERLKLSTPQKVVKDKTEYFVSFSSTVRSYKAPILEGGEQSTTKAETSPAKVEKKTVPAKKAPNKKSVTIKNPPEESAPAVAAEATPVVEQPAPVSTPAPEQTQPVAKKNPPAKSASTASKQAPKKK